MKSINFSYDEIEIPLKNKHKKQTTRGKKIPKMIVGEIVMIQWYRKDLYPVKITKIYPKMFKDLTKNEAFKDGFNRLKDYKEALRKIYDLKPQNYVFIIQWNPLSHNSLENFPLYKGEI